MNKLRIVYTSGKYHVFEFIGWKSDRSAIYVEDKEGNVRVISIHPVPLTIRDLDCQIINLHYNKMPFSSELPERIEPTRLIPPPCRSCLEDDPRTFLVDPEDRHKGEPARLTISEPWEALYGSYLYPGAKEIEAIEEALDHFRQAEKQQFIKQKKLKRYNTLDKDGKSKPTWELTLEDVIEMNNSGIRDRVLVDTWMEESGYDLKQMNKELQGFKRQLRNCVHFPEHLDELPEPQWKQLAAQIRYKILFTDKSCCWLAKIGIPRNSLEESEVKQIESLKRHVKKTYSCKDVQESLDLKEDAVRRYLKDLRIDPNNISKSDLERMKQHKEKKGKGRISRDSIRIKRPTTADK